MKKHNNHNEHDLQKSCVQWFRLQHKGVITFAIPNGGKRDLREAVRLKAEGVMSGVADLFVMSPFDSDAKGLFIEMKIKDGKQSDTQKEFELKCIENGYNYAIARTIDEFMNIVNDFLR